MTIRLVENLQAMVGGTYPDTHLRTLSPEASRTAADVIKTWPGYQRTPLHSLGAMASELGVQSVHYKDESPRFGLDSFKALGGAYAIYRTLEQLIHQRHPDAKVSIEQLVNGDFAEVANQLTVCSATDGNHGRSVAWGAKLFGCRAIIYIHETVSQEREAAIAQYGAEVIRNPGHYDDAVRAAADDAASNGWTVVSDTSWPGYSEIPSHVMHGYTVMVEEALRSLDTPPTHIFIQGGVGGLAAAVCAQAWWELGSARPIVVVVEPENAACLTASAENAALSAVHGDLETIMAGLACGEPSMTAWPILRDAARWFIAIPDELAANTMRRLAHPLPGDGPIVAGESAVAGLAACIEVAQSASQRQALRLDQHARVLVFGTEGATDRGMYEQIVGKSPADVLKEA